MTDEDETEVLSPHEVRARAMGIALADASAGTPDDVPPGFTLTADPNGSMWWRIAEVDCWGHDSWDDEYEGETRHAAATECWVRFARANPEWARRMLAWLRLPKLPELPPGYTIGECDDGSWALYVNGDLHDGLDDTLESRDDAVDMAWDDWVRFISPEWHGFVLHVAHEIEADPDDVSA